MITRSKISLLWGYGATNALKSFQKYNLIYNLTGSVRESQLNNPHNALVSLILMFGVLFTLVLVIFVSILLFGTLLKALKTKDFRVSLIPKLQCRNFTVCKYF